MSLAGLVILSVKVEGRSKSEVAATTRSAVTGSSSLVKRYEAEGKTAI